jgi:hypothetical protein
MARKIPGIIKGDKELSMRRQQNYPGMLTNNLQLGPYPMEKLKRVNKPTNLITDNVQRIDFNKEWLAAWDYSVPSVQKPHGRVS